MSTPLYGLLLTGGRSRRMQRDKATLDYAGQPQLARALALLEPLVTRAFVSVRADQLADPQRAAHACIADIMPGMGPIAGIHAALHAFPAAAWLVLACDLPFLDAATLQQLIAARDPRRLATAFRSSHDGKPEPLCAIFEPASLGPIDAWIAGGQLCPRSFLAAADVALLTLRSPQALDNINTGDEYRAARGRLGAGAGASEADAGSGDGDSGGEPGPQRQLQVRYFALLREQAGRHDEMLNSRARDARELYEELRERHGLLLRPEQLRVAVNAEFADWSQPLREGDSVAFLPPVAGG
ncbi:MAG: NTP transferase domain-containing protein [Gammaproteobacteria bacterium]|nr:NTP transferase domain-containing protein [Gammaproteobacteria bacterium]MDE2251764.1 NTP transferase domain-containing protein [Gammaproteobacteria bacterium]